MPTFSLRPLSGLLAAAALLSACHKDDPDTTPQTAANYALSTVSGAYPNQTTYVQGLKDFSAPTIDNKNATESTSFGSLFTYKQAVYLCRFGAPATLIKYTFDPTTGKAVEAGRLAVPGANTFSTLQFISDTEAYASINGGLAQLIKFNPTTLTTTGSVDLSKLKKTGAADTYYLGSAVSGSKLFLGVHYFNAQFDPLRDSAFVAVIDLPTAKVEKLLADGRTAAIFNAGSSVNSFYQDASGDIYVQGNGTDKVPSGVLRIKSGTTAFDPSYFFNLKATTGQDCMGLRGFAGGLAFTGRIEDPADPYESKGPNYRLYKLDLNAKTAAALPGLPLIYGASSQLAQQFDSQYITLGVAGKTQNSLYQYKLSDGTLSKQADVTGMPTGLAKLN